MKKKLHKAKIKSEIELESIITPSKKMASHTKPSVVDKTDVVGEIYSSQSTAELVEDSIENVGLNLPHVCNLFGASLGLVFWLFLKICPKNIQKKVLSFLSPFRSGVKSVATFEETIAISGVLGMRTQLGIGLASGVGILSGIFLASHIIPEIKLLEDKLQRQIELNHLLLKHFQSKSNRVPMGLTHQQLLQWLKDPPQFTDLPMRDMVEADFQSCSAEEGRHLLWLKILMDMITGVYTVNMANTDLGLMHISGFMSNPVSLAFNLAAGTALVASYYQIANYSVQTQLLNVEHSYLTGVLAFQQQNICQEDNESASKLPVIHQTKHNLEKCDQKLLHHKKINLDHIVLTNAALNGFKEGGQFVNAMTSPLAILAFTHVVSLSCPPLFFSLLAVTLTVCIARATWRYVQKKQELSKNTVAQLTQFKPKEIQSPSLFAWFKQPRKAETELYCKNLDVI